MNTISEFKYIGFKYPELKHAWVDPCTDNINFRAGVTSCSGTILVRGGAHKTIEWMEAVPNQDIEGDWEIFNVTSEGNVDGVDYFWGMFLEGIGAFDICVRKENARLMNENEYEAWKNRVMGMYSGGELSYTLPSNVKPYDGEML